MPARTASVSKLRESSMFRYPYSRGRAEGRASGRAPSHKNQAKTKSPLCVGISGLRCGTTAIDSGRLPPAFALAVLGSRPASAS
ncbi:hypothetical protein DID99_24685 [Burkholderia sp. Bp8986]|nr:hypothetical protein DID99_24685 [Burkholderia sp. Bp8986]